jgi:hypothetical protein
MCCPLRLSPTPLPQNVTVFRDRFLKEVIILNEIIDVGLNPV